MTINSRYRVFKTDRPDLCDLGWEEGPWQHIASCALTAHMGERPRHFPDTRVKMAWGTRAVSLIFRVADRYVLARAAGDQDPVCRDSCVEFFFTPGTDLSLGYFNLEVNCGGTILFHFQKRPRRDSLPVSAEGCRAVRRVHCLPKVVDPEIPTPVVWTVALTFPVEILEGYCPVTRPHEGAVWRANFYKCADACSHPHWLTWAPVASAVPDFHVPSSFGCLEFV